MKKWNVLFSGSLFLGLSFSVCLAQVSLEIKNVDLDAKTLDIYMSNEAGCSSCDDTLYNTKTLCESSGNNTAGGTWSFSNSMTSDDCAAVNGVYFDGEVAGIEFKVAGITVESDAATGGTAEAAAFIMLTSMTSSDTTAKVLGYYTGGKIAAGSDQMLTSIAFTEAEGSVDDICFYGDSNIISDSNAKVVDTNWISACDSDLAVQLSDVLPVDFSISQNFPNPFNPSTSISFNVTKIDDISIKVYDLTGKEVATLVSGVYSPGTYIVEWNALNNSGYDVASGMYIYKYVTSEFIETKKMLYLK